MSTARRVMFFLFLGLVLQFEVISLAEAGFCKTQCKLRYKVRRLFSKKSYRAKVQRCIRRCRNKRKKLICEPFAVAGSVGYKAAAVLIRKLNRRRVVKELTHSQKKKLRPMYGDLVDKVRILYQAKLLDDWKIMGKRISHSSDAMAFGYSVYVKEPFKSSSWKQIALFAHELKHVEQFERFGGSFTRFGRKYFRAYCRAGFHYAKNRLEQEAQRARTKFEVNER